MSNIVEVKVSDKYKLFIKYSDGVEGEISLQHLKDDFTYQFLNDKDEFEKVYVDEKTGDIFWPNSVNLCKNAIYRQLELKCMMKRLKIDMDKL